MNYLSGFFPILLGVICLKKPGLFRHERWNEDSFIIIRTMGVTLVVLGLALMLVKG